MSNFIEKAKDLYFSDTKKYNHFKKVFSRIERMSYVKNFYNTNLLNIEDILSILETERQITGKYYDFKRLIIDVISENTPQIFKNKRTAIQGFVPTASVSGMLSNIFPNSLSSIYSYFIMSLFALQFESYYDNTYSPYNRRIRYSKMDTPNHYSIITLNYDLIPESICKIVNDLFPENNIAFIQTISDNDELAAKNYLAKLHGCISTNEIIPPTWNKGLISKNIKQAWKIAHELLKNAHHIRILGYSLPINDSYIKYLLRASVLENEHLKRIDILCKDDRISTVQKRYSDFIEFENTRFVNKGIEDFLSKYHHTVTLAYGGSNNVKLDRLENFHNEYFSENISWLS